MNKIDGEVAHPVVRLHPETGERAVFVSPMFTSHVVGMPPSESDELLAELHEHCAEERFVYEHHWKVGETVLWDNRSSMQCVHRSSLEKSFLACAKAHLRAGGVHTADGSRSKAIDCSGGRSRVATHLPDAPPRAPPPGQSTFVLPCEQRADILEAVAHLHRCE